ncbi:hypothetical protein UFOVP648_12 [uncultured Caudovirales phage]|uniref:Uncharacterized protein n=1 Tax=uncultured Caudovirales phage TaxID=2100421 RepID=A0A6J5N4R6_9CAUD|nr:hypothetical protein UFOVP648_12 [uncultured Caudovirales phage]
MNNINTDSAYYLNPVYRPINISSYFSEDNSTGSTYSISIFFLSTPMAIVDGNYFKLNNVTFTFKDLPSQNQIPTSDVLTDNLELIFLIKEVIENNPIFDNYQITVYNGGGGVAVLRLTHRIPFTTDRIVFSTNNPTWISVIDEQIPQYTYLQQGLTNYSIWVDVFTNDYKYPFYWTQTTATTTTLPIQQTTLYKSFQSNNSYVFDISPILQSVSQTTLPYLAPNVTVYEKDSNSLNNFGLKFYESYDVTFSSGTQSTTTIRRFPLNNNDSFGINNQWYWDAARFMTLAERESYYSLDTQYIQLRSDTINGRTQLLFKYQLDIGETISIENNSQTIVYTASTTNDIYQFRIETNLSGTVENFLTAFASDFSNYTYSYTAYGYSQVYVDLDNLFSDVNDDLITSGSSNGHIVRTDFLPSRTENIIDLEYPPEEGVNEQSIIKFLTDRPRAGTRLYYNATSGNAIYYRYNKLSAFLSIYENVDDGLPILGQGFFTRVKYYEDGQWSDTWSDSLYTPWEYKTVTLEGADNGLYHIQLDPLYLSAITTTEKIRYAIGWYILKDDGGSGLSYIKNYTEEFEYDIEKLCDYQSVKTFLFLNDLGGWDNYDFIEDLTIEYTRDSTLIGTDSSGSVTVGTTYEQIFQNSIEESYRLKTVVNSQAEYDWLYQLVKSARVYLITYTSLNIDNSYFQKVIITKTDFQETENTNQWILNIEYRIARKDTTQKSV